MKRVWETEELVEHWTLVPPELELLGNKTGPTRLGFALLLKFFQSEARFPKDAHEIPETVINYVAKQVGASPECYPQYEWHGRTIEYHRARIRKLHGFREATVNDANALTQWLSEQVLPQERDYEHLKVAVYRRCRELQIEPPTPERIDRLVRSATRTYEENFCAEISAPKYSLAYRRRTKRFWMLCSNPPLAKKVIKTRGVKAARICNELFGKP